MKKRIKSFKVLFLFAITMFLFYSLAFLSYSLTPTPTQTPLPPTSTPTAQYLSIDSDKFLFIDTRTDKEGVGEVDGFMYIDFPTYSMRFDGTLESFRPIRNYNESTQVIVGKGLSLGGTAGSGAGTDLYPYSTTYSNDLFYVDSDYTVHYYYNKAWRTIMVGETWTEKYEEKPYDTTKTGKYIITNTIKNYGIMSKSQLKQPSSPTPRPTNTPIPTAKVVHRKISGSINSDIKSLVDKSGFKVEIPLYGYNATAITDKNGMFKIDELIKYEPFKVHNVIISKPGYLTRSFTIELVRYDELQFGTGDNPLVMISGDINNDNVINMLDVILLAKCFNFSSSEIGFNTIADLNMDNVVNMADVMALARNFNLCSNDYSDPEIISNRYPTSIPSNQIVTPTATPDLNTTFTKVISSYPENFAQNAKAKESVIKVNFDSKKINVGENYRKIKILDENNEITYSVRCENNTLILQTDFQYSSECTIIIPKGSVKDENGCINDDYSFSFTTEKRPSIFMKIVDTTPKNGANNVVDNKITIKFDTDSNINLGYNREITITDNNVSYGFTIGIVDNNPYLEIPGFTKNKKYLIQIPEGAFKDDKGIYNKAYEFSYTTAP